jgi:signal peptidase I
MVVMMISIKFVAVVGCIPLLLYLWPSFLAGDTEYVIVYGTSMLPNIPHGALAVAKKDINYEVGDIISFKQEGRDRMIVHRIVGQTENGFVTQGDNIERRDPGTVTLDEINGKVVFVTPYFGFLALFLKNPLVLTLFILTTGALMTSTGKNRKKKQSHEYGFFLPAIVINLVSYMVLQISISVGIVPQIDGYTSFLLRIFEPYIAGTLSFASWHLAITATYLIARRHGEKFVHSVEAKANRTLLQLKAGDNVVLFLAQILWLLFTTLQMIYITSMLTDLIPVLSQ